jgi:hypothetical protein
MQFMRSSFYTCIALIICEAALITEPVLAQQINGVAGSANATVTLDGKQLPPPPLPFGGVIKGKRQGFHAVVAAARGPAQGRTQHPANHD